MTRKNMEVADSLIQDRIQHLRENTDFVSTVFDSLVGYAIIAADFDGNIIAYNEGAHQIYGYAPEEVIGRKNLKIFFPEEFVEAGGLEHIVSELVEKGRLSYEGEKVRKDCKRFSAHLLFTLTKDKYGRVVGFVEIVKDLTSQKQAEALFIASEARLRLIIENNADSMLIVDGKGTIRFVNPATKFLFARPEKELLGSAFGFPTISGERTEIDIVRPATNERVVAEMRVKEIEWHGGEMCYLASLRDVTDRKKAVEKLNRANEELKKLDSMKSEFIAVASHELRTPLTSIKNAIDILVSKKAGDLTENQERFLSMAGRNVNRLSTMINSLLDLRKLEAGKLDLQLSEVDIVGMLHQVAEAFKPQADTKLRILTVDSSEDVSTVYADPGQVEQILYNLVSNAIKFTPEGGTVQLSARQIKLDTESECACQDFLTPSPSGWAEISVADTGCGLSPDDQVHIFEPFYQAGDVLTLRSKGSGLGLSIVKELVESQMGQISVESEIGKGSRFFFTLPVFSPQSIGVAGLHEGIRQASKDSSFFSLLQVCFDPESLSDLNHMETNAYPELLNQLMSVVHKVICRRTDHVIAQQVFLSVIIILESTPKKEAAIVKRKLDEAFSLSPIVFEGKTLSVPTILGPATFPEDGVTTKELVAAVKRNVE